MGSSCAYSLLAILMKMNRESTIANARVETSRFNSIHFTTSLE
jgi:hypothetical protein